jgi:predicted site-specific integrase-resolvase
MRVAIYARVSTDDRRLSHDRPTSLTSSQRNTSAHGLLPQCGRSLAEHHFG